MSKCPKCGTHGAYVNALFGIKCKNLKCEHYDKTLEIKDRLSWKIVAIPYRSIGIGVSTEISLGYRVDYRLACPLPGVPDTDRSLVHVEGALNMRPYLAIVDNSNKESNIRITVPMEVLTNFIDHLREHKCIPPKKKVLEEFDSDKLA